MVMDCKLTKGLVTHLQNFIRIAPIHVQLEYNYIQYIRFYKEAAFVVYITAYKENKLLKK